MTVAELSALLPRAILAISYSPDATSSQNSHGERRVHAAAVGMSYVGFGKSDTQGTSIWLGGNELEGAVTKSGRSLTALLNQMPRGAVDAKELGCLLPDGTQEPPCLGTIATRILTTLTPPFAIVSCRGESHPVVAATDYLGYRQFYYYQGDGWAAISTSSLALARCAGADLDRESLAARSLLGFHLSGASPYAGVRKLGPGGICVLADGKLHLGRYVDDGSLVEHRSEPFTAELVHDVANFLREVTRDHLEQHPELVLQLSGGLDSRIQLAAIPSQLRPGLRSLTLCQSGSPDANIARHLALTNKLDHQELSLEPIGYIDPATAHALVCRAALRHDCSGDPLAQAVLDWAEGQLGTEPRIHGAGGEFARGFYYPGQRQHQQGNTALVDRLAKWRLFTNEPVESACMGQSRAEWAQETTLVQLRRIFNLYNGDWLSATDAFYLRERMAHWAGARLSVASTERTLLGSLMHPKFVSLVQQCPPEYKRGSRFMAQVLYELDPGLARIPLDSGYVPVQLADSGLVAHVRSCHVTARKVMNKARRQLSHTGRPGTGASLLASRVLEHWRSQPDLLDGLAHLEMIDNNWLS